MLYLHNADDEKEEQGDKAVEQLMQGLCQGLERTADANAMQPCSAKSAISALAKVSEMHKVQDYRVLAVRAFVQH